MAIESTNHTNYINELTLFGVISSSGSDVESIDSELPRELARQIDVVEESIESFCTINGQTSSIVEVAHTKQTAHNQTTGLPMATFPPASRGVGSGGGVPPASGAGGGPARNPLPGGGSSNPPTGTSGRSRGVKSPRTLIARRFQGRSC